MAPKNNTFYTMRDPRYITNTNKYDAYRYKKTRQVYPKLFGEQKKRIETKTLEIYKMRGTQDNNIIATSITRICHTMKKLKFA